MGREKQIKNENQNRQMIIVNSVPITKKIISRSNFSLYKTSMCIQNAYNKVYIYCTIYRYIYIYSSMKSTLK